MLIAMARMIKGPKALNISWGAGSYCSHSKNLGKREKNIIKRTISRMMGKKLSRPIITFEFFDIQWLFY
jgi:hypothetical protein